MKSIFVFFGLVLATSMVSADECSSDVSAIKYTSKTTLGTRTIYEDPYVLLGDGRRAKISNYGSSLDAQGFCQALGHKKSVLTTYEKSSLSDLIIRFNNDGSVNQIWSSSLDAYPIVKYAICDNC